ncbi:HET-domain-containing protein [Rostrohypoxylon terebratum]|nr:HET-domain-containing protein [Rostrohypoxylon terebratum]
MWLINCQSLHLEEFVQDVPPYAILSHTWGDEEMTFVDMNNRNWDRLSDREGYQKMRATCRVALEHNLKYAWVDTCCIDKSSSAELSEAINSMFAWYKKAAICFVYLYDFTCFTDETLANATTSFESREALEVKGEGFYGDLPQQSAAEIDLRNKVKRGLGDCKWFSRGWTLQELIAPSRINFYDKEWNYFGSKLDLASILSWITGVDTDILKGKPLDNILVGRRMSWASNRETTRVEDMAYCLLGIFDINMPLLYGEGKKAFIRLQEEIIRSSHDLSIFAWTADVDDLRRFRGLMANSPAEFNGCQRLVKPAFEWNNGGEYGLTSRGLRTDGLIRIGRGETGQAGSYFMSLGCVDERQKKLVMVISLWQYGPGLFARQKPWHMAMIFDLNVYSAAKLTHPQYICCKDSASLEKTVLSSRINAIQIRLSSSIFDIDSIAAFPQADWDLRNSMLLSFQRPYYWGLWKAKVADSDDGITIVCVRSSGWLLYGIFASNQTPPALSRDDLLPSHVENILQRIPDRTSTKCSGFIHTVKDVYLDLGETGAEIPATLLQVNSVETKELKQRRSKIKLVQGLFRKSKSM